MILLTGKVGNTLPATVEAFYNNRSFHNPEASYELQISFGALAGYKATYMFHLRDLVFNG